MTRIKVCGITRVEDVETCLALGVDTLGFNFFRGSKRHCAPERARALVSAVGGRAECVGVFVDASLEEVRATLAITGIEWAQLHGGESPEMVAALLPKAFKALGVRDVDPLGDVRRFPGDHVLLDTYVPGALTGGTGQVFDWSLAHAVARERKLTLAGGLVPDNVEAAVRAVRPHRVDVASGVESAPGVKDSDLVRAFVAAVRRADAPSHA